MPHDTALSEFPSLVEWQAYEALQDSAPDIRLTPYVRHIPDYFGPRPFNIEVILARPPVLGAKQIGRILPADFKIGASGDLQVYSDMPLPEELVNRRPDLNLVAGGIPSAAPLGVESGVPIIPLAHPGYGIYGHWLIDICPRVAFFRALFPDSAFHLLVPDDLAAWAGTLVAEFFPDADMIIKVRKEVAYTGELFLCSPFRYHDHLSRMSVIARDVAFRAYPLEYDHRPERRLFVSRMHLAKQTRSLINREEVESLFRKSGFETIYPEQMSLREQVAVFSNAAVIAGEAGSGMHNSIFAPAGAATIVLQSARQSHFIQASLDFWGEKRVSLVFCEAQSNDWMASFTADLAEVEKCIRNADRRQNDCASVLMPTRRQPPDPAISTASAQFTREPDTCGSARRINRLATSLGAKRYLEIGAAQGSTLLNVEIGERVGVDPNPDFDADPAAQGVTRIKRMTSDEYFMVLENDEIFDLIFIDGLHTFEQAYRDFCGSLLHAHARTVILIGDTKPADVFSSLATHERAKTFREANGSSGVAWQGDVFKVVFALHDFHLGLNYRTIVGSGDTQTLVWRSTAGLRKPHFNSLEAISRLTYFDLLDHLSHLRECTEDEAIGLCLRDLDAERDRSG